MDTATKRQFADAPKLSCHHFEHDPDCSECWRLITYLFQVHKLDSWMDGQKWKVAWFAAKEIPAGPAARRFIVASASASERAAIEQWKKEWRSLKSAVCHWCHGRFPSKRCEADHVIPIARGGKHVLANHVIACKPCNRRKHAMLPDVWIARMEAAALNG